MWRRVALIGLVAVLAGGAGVALLTAGGDGRPGGNRSPGGPGSVEGVVLDGFGTSEPVDLEAFGGKPLVVNYWASWCVFCIEEMPDFQDVYEQVGRDVEFLGVNIEDDLDLARSLVDATGVRYPLAADPRGSVYRRLRGIAMPTTWFIDEEGGIVERFNGPLTADELRARIRDNFGI